MILLPVPLPLARRLGHAFTLFNMATRVFRNAIPRNPLTLARAAWESRGILVFLFLNNLLRWFLPQLRRGCPENGSDGLGVPPVLPDN